MPDYDPKNIPTLDDIIEGESNDAAAIHEKIIITDEMNADEHTLDLFNDKATDIEIDQMDPEIGTIDKFIDAATDIDVETIRTLDDETDVTESALIDYPLEEDSEENIEDEIIVSHDHTPDEPGDQIPVITEPPAISDPAITLDLDSIIDDIVTRLMPDLEQQLRSQIRQALQEKLPDDIIRQTSSEDDC